jgi:hypothetical protein
MTGSLDEHPPPITQIGTTVLIQGDALPVLYRCVLAGIARHHRDGVASPPLLHELRAQLYRATTTTMSPARHKDAGQPQPVSGCTCQHGDDWIGAGEAAALLQLSRRQVQRMCAEHYWGGADTIRVGRTWALRRAPVLALAAERRKAAE